jgi:tetratricopeptide (TPR) repeat protein
MQFSQRNILAGVVILIIVVAAAYLYLRPASGVPITPGNTLATSSSATSSASAAPISGTPTTIHLGAAQPSFTQPISFAAGIPANVKAALNTQFADVSSQLAKNPTQVDLWLGLGTLRKMGGDYQGAIEDWNYVGKDGNSLSSVAYGNLADLYLNFVKNYPQAEASYKAAIALNPAYPDYYQGLFTLYTTTSYKPSPTAAEDILKQGIAANPKAVDLQVTLAVYYKSLGRTADAKAEFDAAIANAKSQGQTDLAAQIQAEESSL